MFYHLPLEHEIVLHPQYFGKDLQTIIERKIYSEVEGSCQGYIGYIVCITAITFINHGEVSKYDDCMARFLVKYNAIVFRPFKNEVFDGTIKQINKVGIFVEVGPMSCFISHNSMPSSMEFCPNINPPCYKTKDEHGEVIAAGGHVRLKIVGLRTDINGMFAIGSLMDDFLGPIE